MSRLSLIEVGRAQAIAFAVTRRASVSATKAQLPVWFEIHTEGSARSRLMPPALWGKIAGIADGLDISMEQRSHASATMAVRMPTGGCSADHRAAMCAGRNYDFRPRGYEARFALLQPTGSYASIGSTPRFNRTARWHDTSTGLTIGLHLVKVRPRFPGLTSTLLVRRVLDSCATTAEAVALLRRLPRHEVQLFIARCWRRRCGSSKRAPEPWWLAVAIGSLAPIISQAPQLRRLNPRVAHSISRLPPLESSARASAGCRTNFTALNVSASPAFHDYGNAQRCTPSLPSRPATVHDRKSAAMPPRSMRT